MSGTHPKLTVETNFRAAAATEMPQTSPTTPGGTRLHMKTSFGGRGRGDAQFLQPFAVCVDDAGRIFVSDTKNHRVQVFERTQSSAAAAAGGSDAKVEYRLVRKFGGFGSEPGLFYVPRGIAYSSARKEVIVVDSLNHRVQRFTEDGAFVGFVGPTPQPKKQQQQQKSPAPESSPFSFPIGVAVDALTDRIFVTDSGGISVFSGSNPEAPAQRFTLPRKSADQLVDACDVVVNQDGNIVVSDCNSLSARVCVFDSAGNFLFDFAASEFKRGAWLMLATDRRANIYVADYELKLLCTYDRNGVLLASHRTAASVPGSPQRPYRRVGSAASGLAVAAMHGAGSAAMADAVAANETTPVAMSPTGLAFDPFSQDIVVADSENHMIHVISTNHPSSSSSSSAVSTGASPVTPTVLTLAANGSDASAPFHLHSRDHLTSA